MTSDGTSSRRSHKEAAGFAGAMAAFFYFLGWLALRDALWFADLRWWWFTLLGIVLSGLMYYQARMNKLGPIEYTSRYSISPGKLRQELSVTGSSAKGRVGRSVGVVLVAVGALVVLFAVIGLAYGGGWLGSSVIGGFGVVIGGGGLVLRRANPPGPRERALGSDGGPLERYAAPVFIGVLAVLLVVSFGGGMALLRSATPADRSSGAVFVAISALFASVIALAVVARSGGGTGARYLAICSGFVVAAVVLVVLGITGRDARQLLLYGAVAAVVAVGAGVVAARNRM